MKTIFTDAKAVQCISPQSGNNTTLNGTTIDLTGHDGIEFVCAVGAQDAVVTFKVQVGTLSDGSDMADVTGLSQAFSATDDNKVTILSLRESTKRYARVVATLGNGTAQLVSAIGLLVGNRQLPEAQSFGGVLKVGA